MKIICIGRNYAAHARELQNPVPEEPVIFLKPASALLPPGASLRYPEFTKDLQYECEIVLQICRQGKDIPPEAAHAYFERWTVGIDFTARDLQQALKKKGLPWELAKAFDGSAAVGTFIPCNAGSGGNATFSLQQNGMEMQSGNTSDMLFSFEKTIHFASRYFTLDPGDLIFTGTPEGVGPVHPSDRLECFLDGQRLLQVAIT